MTDALHLATTHTSLFTQLWDDEKKQMSTRHNNSNYWIVLISEYVSLFYQKQKEIEQYTAKPQCHQQAMNTNHNIPMMRYNIPIKQILDEREKASTQAETHKQQGVNMLGLILPPWHNCKDTSIWGQDKYGMDLIRQTMDMLFTVDPQGWLHLLLTVRTHHPLKKWDAVPINIPGELDKYFQGTTTMEYGQTLHIKFSFQSKLTNETIILRFNDIARQRN